MRLSQIHLVLFLSRATPFKRWQELGVFGREVAIYQRLRSYLKDISIVTSGPAEEMAFQQQLGDVTILYNRLGMSPNFYSIAAPIVHHHGLRQGTIYKTNQFDGSWTAVLAAKLYRKPVVVRAGYLWAEFYRQEGGQGIRAWLMSRLQHFVLNNATIIVLTSERMKETVVQNYGIDPRRIQVVPNYVDTELFCPASKVPKLTGRILCVGRLHPRKNLANLIQALAGLSEVTLQIIGRGEQRQELEKLSMKHQVKTVFIDGLAHHLLPGEINRAEIFVLPSLFEGHPKAVVEAMSCGAAVVAADVPGIREVVTHEETGLLCAPTVEGIRPAIQRLLHDGELRHRLGLAARAFIQEHFSLDRIVDLELEVIERAQEGRA